MKLSQQSLSRIESTIQKAMERFLCEGGASTITDIHLQPIPASGELFIYDDDDNELSNNIINEWTNANEATFYKDAERTIRTILSRMKENGMFSKASIVPPYSFVLIDDEKETISELLIIDDDLLLVNEELLKGLDEELDDFLKDLLEK